MKQPNRVRLADPDPIYHRPVAPKCDAPGCMTPTRERKPYCSDHVGEHPYVRELLQQLEGRERELERVAKRGAKAVDVRGITAHEVILQLRLYGSRTVPRLSRDLGLDEATIDAYARALCRHGVVTLGRTRRGLTLVVPADLEANSQGGWPTAGNAA